MTLNQKINVRGELAIRGVGGLELVRLTKKKIVHYWGMTHRRSILVFLKTGVAW